MSNASTPDLAALSRVLASDTRAAMVLAMVDGQAWTLSELAAAAVVSRSAASEHADRLTASGITEEVRQGRHRYLRVRDVHVADAIEALAALTSLRPAAQSLSGQRHDAAVRAARSCYRHLAGRLGVALCDGMTRDGLISESWALTPNGTAWLGERAIRIPVDRRRAMVRPCLDWTERRPHPAGSMGDALFAGFCERGWLEQVPGSRAVHLTELGRSELGAWLG